MTFRESLKNPRSLQRLSSRWTMSTIMQRNPKKILASLDP
jgi:hypothetical protein